MEDLDLRSIHQARRLLQAAHEAAGALAALSQESIDSIIDAIHEAALPRAEEWARMAVEETGFGNVPDKTRKNRFAADDVYRFIRPLRTVGILREDPDRGLVEIAAPAGVVAAIVPSTNPTSTAINNILIALKAACPVVISPHPSAGRCVQEVSRVLSEAACSAGAPTGSLGCLTEVALPGTRELMQHPRTGLILSTGGTGLVRAAYSSGKPAFGVGPGNVPAYVDRSADPAKAARDIVAGKTFDNGVLCSAENAVVAHLEIDQALRTALEEAGCRFLDQAETEKLSRLVVTPAGALNTAIVGKDAAAIARMAGLDACSEARCLVATLDQVGPQAPLSREKLSPILAYYVERDWEAACERCLEILRYGGMGHTMAVHASDDDLVRKFALGKPVFRLVVNTPSSVGAVGITTGLAPSMTLGCGALGGNITSDNITPLHLINLKRLAHEMRPYEPAPLPEAPAGRPKEGLPRPSLPQLPRTPIPCCAASAPPANPVGEPVPTPPRPDLRGPRLRERVSDLLHSRLPAPAQGAPSPAAGSCKKTEGDPGGSCDRKKVEPRRKAAPFVCEADVRQAMTEGRKITVSAATIITPSARDLGGSHQVFIRI